MRGRKLASAVILALALPSQIQMANADSSGEPGGWGIVGKADQKAKTFEISSLPDAAPAQAATKGLDGRPIKAGQPILEVPVRTDDGDEIKWITGRGTMCVGEVRGQICHDEPICDNTPGGVGYYSTYTPVVNGERGRTQSGPVRCPGDASPRLVGEEGEDVEEVVPRAPEVTLAELQKLNVVSAEANVQPSPHTLIKRHTNVYAEAQTQTFDTEIGGFDVTIRAIPVSYTFNYGDGTSRGPMSDPGQRIDDTQGKTETATSHVYQETGLYGVSVTTTYRGEFTYDGNPYQPIDGTIDVTSDPTDLTVWRAVVRNVADDCLKNPGGWACGGPTDKPIDKR